VRQRVLCPSFFVDEGLVTVSPFARLLFAGLWCVADREGRLEYRPIRLKMLLFPADDVDVETLTQELERIGVVVRYDSEDFGPLLWVRHFLKHQHPHHREAGSILPPYDGPSLGPSVVGKVESLGLSSVESGVSLTVSESESESVSESVKDIRSKERASTDRFDEWWAAYPKKVGKIAARKAYAKALTIVPAHSLLAAVKNNGFNPDRRYIPNPTTWLNQGRWDDEPVPFAEEMTPDGVAVSDLRAFDGA
jgi:hypothetical protein